MTDKFTYNSFGKDESASEIEGIRQQVIKQEVTKVIRERERERVRQLIQEQEQKPKFVFTDTHKEAGRGLFVFLLYCGLITIGWLMLSGIYKVVKYFL